MSAVFLVMTTEYVYLVPPPMEQGDEAAVEATDDLVTSHLSAMSLFNNPPFVPMNLPPYLQWSIPIANSLELDWRQLFADTPHVPAVPLDFWEAAIDRLAFRIRHPGVLLPFEGLCPGIVFGTGIQHPLLSSILGILFVTELRLRRSRTELQDKITELSRLNVHAQAGTWYSRIRWDERRRRNSQRYSVLFTELSDEVIVVRHTTLRHLDALFIHVQL